MAGIGDEIGAQAIGAHDLGHILQQQKDGGLLADGAAAGGAA